MRSKLTAPGAAVAAVTGALILAASPASAQYTQSAPAAQPAQTTQTPMSSPQTQAPMSSPTMQQGTSTQAATDVSSPKTTLASATVQDSSGQSVGQVQSVKTTSGGKTSSVAVSLSSGTSSGKIVSIRASKLRYDPSGNVLKASLSSSEISALPATQSQ
jgi:hypothetical protein